MHTLKSRCNWSSDIFFCIVSYIYMKEIIKNGSGSIHRMLIDGRKSTTEKRGRVCGQNWWQKSGIRHQREICNFIGSLSYILIKNYEYEWIIHNKINKIHLKNRFLFNVNCTLNLTYYVVWVCTFGCSHWLHAMNYFRNGILKTFHTHIW